VEMSRVGKRAWIDAKKIEWPTKKYWGNSIRKGDGPKKLHQGELGAVRGEVLQAMMHLF